MAGREIAPADVLERCVFPVLLPGLEATLRAAKHTERRKRFNALDYLSAYLFRNNPNGDDRAGISFQDIPFVKQEWAVKPRPPLPLSATLTEVEAAAIIQAHYRGYRVRCNNAHVVEFRKWQRRWAEEKIAARKIQRWWRDVSRNKLSHVVARESACIASEESRREGGDGKRGEGEGS